MRPLSTKANDMINEVEWLLGTDSAESIARRLGYRSAASLDRRLLVLNRADLARALRTRQGGAAA